MTARRAAVKGGEYSVVAAGWARGGCCSRLRAIRRGCEEAGITSLVSSLRSRSTPSREQALRGKDGARTQTGFDLQGRWEADRFRRERCWTHAIDNAARTRIPRHGIPSNDPFKLAGDAGEGPAPFIGGFADDGSTCPTCYSTCLA